ALGRVGRRQFLAQGLEQADLHYRGKQLAGYRRALVAAVGRRPVDRHVALVGRALVTQRAGRSVRRKGERGAAEPGGPHWSLRQRTERARESGDRRVLVEVADQSELDRPAGKLRLDRRLELLQRARLERRRVGEAEPPVVPAQRVAQRRAEHAARIGPRVLP